MGRKLVLTGTKLTDTTAPQLVNIDVMESAGSLLLVDLTHPTNPWPAGTPANAARMPNVLAATLAAITGQTGNALLPEWRTSGTTTVARTTRGGISTNGNYSGLHSCEAALDHVVANPTHSYFVSIWGQVDNASGFAMTSQFSSNASTGTGLLYSFYGSGAAPSDKRIGMAGTPVATGSPFRTAAAFNSSSLAGATGSQLRGASGAALFGSTGNLGAAARRSYRYYLEDLTLSGRTWATANALDLELFTAEVLTAGGRYYGDALA